MSIMIINDPSTKMKSSEVFVCPMVSYKAGKGFNATKQNEGIFEIFLPL
jgi:hypothetical protein